MQLNTGHKSSLLSRLFGSRTLKHLMLVTAILSANFVHSPAALAAERVQIDVWVQDARIYGETYNTDVGRSFTGWNLLVLNSNGTPVSFEYQGQTLTTLKYSDSNVPSIYVEPGSYSLQVSCDNCQSFTTQRTNYLNPLLRYESWVTINHLVSWRATLRDTGYSDYNYSSVVMPYVTISIREGNSLVAVTVADENGEFEITGLKTGVPYSVSLSCHIWYKATPCPGNSPTYTVNSYGNYKFFWGNINSRTWSESVYSRSDVYVKRAFYDNYSVTGTLSVSNTNPTIGSTVKCLSNLDTQGDYAIEVGGVIVSSGSSSYTTQWGIISSSSSASYTIQAEDAGKTFKCSVTQKVPFTGAKNISTALYPVAQIDAYIVAPLPAAQVGTKIFPNPYSYDSLVSFENYSWYVDGVLVSDNKSSYVPEPSDEGKTLTYRVNALKSGYAQKTILSQSRMVVSGDLGYSAPTVSGNFKVGSMLTASQASWNPEPYFGWPTGVSVNASFSYQWMRDGVAIPDATSPTYLLSSYDANRQVSVQVTSSATGFVSSTRTSIPESVAPGSLTLTPRPSLSGVAKVGETLQINPGVWDQGAVLSYRWYFDNGSAIIGATSDSYKLPVGSLGHKIFVTVRGDTFGFDGSGQVSESVTVTEGDLNLTPTPWVVGVAKVGSPLTAVPGWWDEGVSLSYQWFRDDVPISGDWRNTYTLTGLDYGHQISVAVTGSRAGYVSSTRKSAAFSVAPNNFVLTATPSFTGVAKVGRTLTADSGTWDQDASLSYQWLRNGVEISGANSSSYLLSVTDDGQLVSVAVTGSATGYVTSTQVSEPAAVGSGSLVLVRYPSISGVAKVGSTLTAIPGAWDKSVALAYQWFRNGVAITDSTDSTYLLTPADGAAQISVQVIASTTGYDSSISTTQSVEVALGNFEVTKSPFLSGTAIVGSALSAETGQWDSGVAFSYQWFSDYIPINLATSPTYVLTANDLGKRVFVRVTGNATGFNSVSLTSPYVLVDIGSLTLTPTPTLSGIAKYGSALTVVPGSWDANASLSYQWFRDGVKISNATGLTYLLSIADIGRLVSVQVTGSAAGYASSTATSAPVLVAPISFVLTPLPSLSGEARFGSSLTAVPGSWDSNASLSYQWLRDGVAISNATGLTYLLSIADIGRLVSVQVTGSATGHASVTQISASVSVESGILKLTPTPTFMFGVSWVGSDSLILPGVWDQGVSLTYQWFIDGAVVTGANALTYKPTVADYGHQLTFSVTGSAAGFVSSTQTSRSNYVRAGTLPLSPTPTLSGVAKVGSTLTANPGFWGQNVSLSYQWLRDGEAISGATSSSYFLSAAPDYGHQISVSVTGSAAGYVSSTQTSSSLSVGPGNLALNPTVGYSGGLQVGRTLTVQPGNWDNGVALTYQWLRDGSPIIETPSWRETYILTSADYGHQVSVSVTGSLLGYSPLTQTSSSMLIGSGILSPTTFPTLSGIAKVGSTLTADPGTWDQDVTVSYQWFRDDVEIPKATSSEYLLTAADSGSWVNVQVIGSATGYLPSVTGGQKPLMVAPGSIALTPIPSWSGVAKVGSTLTAVPGTWDLGVSLSYRWIRDYVPIIGATARSYLITADDNGHQIFVEVKGSADGYVSAYQLSAPASVGSGNLVLAPNPSLSGSPKVGSSLTVMSGRWDKGVSLTYQWFRDAVLIPGATGATHLLTVDDAARKVSVSVTGSLPGYLSATRSTSGISVSKGTMKITSPRISGSVKSGQTVKAVSSIWVQGASISYAWLLDGKLIQGATGQTFKLTTKHKTHKLSLKVTQNCPGYSSATATTVAYKVG